jgi:hypothetical protein
MYSDVGAAIVEGEGEGEVVGAGTHPAMNTIVERERAVRMMTEIPDRCRRRRVAHTNTYEKLTFPNRWQVSKRFATSANFV